MIAGLVIGFGLGWGGYFLVLCCRLRRFEATATGSLKRTWAAVWVRKDILRLPHWTPREKMVIAVRDIPCRDQVIRKGTQLTLREVLHLWIRSREDVPVEHP